MAQSGLRLDLRQAALRGGDYGPVIIPGKSAESKLILRLAGSDAGLQMPPTGALSEEEIGIFRAWIDQGAEMPGRANESIRERKPTDPKVQAFLDLIHTQDTARFRNALKANKALAKSADSFGSTALMHASLAGTVDMMNALLAAGADPNAKNTRNATALLWAVNNPAKLQVLLSHGADVNAKSVEGRSALYLAAMQPAGAPIVRILLDAGADPNLPTIVGVTPLFPAMVASLESAQLLLAKGANPNAKTAQGGTPLMSAANSGNPKAVALLLAKGVDVNARTKRGETALANAANEGSFESVNMLLEKGADPNTVDYRGYTPLMHAAYNDAVSADLIRLLLAKGAKIDVTGEGETPYSLAAKRGETEVSRLLRR